MEYVLRYKQLEYNLENLKHLSKRVIYNCGWYYEDNVVVNDVSTIKGEYANYFNQGPILFPEIEDQDFIISLEVLQKYYTSDDVKEELFYQIYEDKRTFITFVFILKKICMDSLLSKIMSNLFRQIIVYNKDLEELLLILYLLYPVNFNFKDELRKMSSSFGENVRKIHPYTLLKNMNVPLISSFSKYFEELSLISTFLNSIYPKMTMTFSKTNEYPYINF